ncbi:sugar kinase (plasmid) [Thioclava sp. 'Guangxiensis']|uniref:sugar kinase n=1 Tax=Thioclava sp. 'Guangxiensis' TaxID=3149044 RepID=UPI0032C476F2
MTRRKGLLAVGECMVEMSGGENDLYRLGFAGDTLNTAWHLKSALTQRGRADLAISYHTALGDDSLSDRIIGFLQMSQLGVETVQRIPGRRPGLYMIEQRNGDRDFIYWRETSAARQMADDAEALHAAFAKPEWIYFSGITLAILSADARATFLQALETACKDGAQIAFDPNLRPRLWEDGPTMCRNVEAAAALADIIFPSFDDEAHHFGDADPVATCARYRALSPRSEIIVKDGPAPLHLALPEVKPVEITLPPVTMVVDATGAGDGFNAGYIAARLCGLSANEAVHSGIALSASVLGHHGAIP